MRNSRGFTFIELVLVLVVVMILSRSVISAIRSAIDRIRLESAADKLTSDARYAQYMATGTDVWYGISFEAAAERYTVYTTTGTADTAVKDPADQRSNFIVNLSSLYGTNIATVTVEGGAPKIEFKPDGSPWRDRTSAALTAESVITLSNGAGARTVRVTPRTGRIYSQ
ncbi:MAG: prepilin-type N-terminal cleavage/methylation domain-containing protein [Candidatus Saganbacteria bacterium]|nr:prepilin-type N-terminal cleavage/methylation domain-containing protein [Candidatus Saganbacteria bacterium]